MNKEVLWYGHSVVGSPGAAGCSVPGGGGDEAVAAEGKAGQEHGVGGGLLTGDGAPHWRLGGCGGDRARAAGADGDPALADAASRPWAGAAHDRSRARAPEAHRVRQHRRERGVARLGRLRGLWTVLLGVVRVSRLTCSYKASDIREGRSKGHD